MKTLKLNVYRADDHSVVEKTYTSEDADIMFGVAEDFLSIIDFDHMKDRRQAAVNILRAFGSLKPLLKDVFHGLTDDELARTKLKEVLPLWVDVFDALMNDMEPLQSKNGMRA